MNEPTKRKQHEKTTSTKRRIATMARGNGHLIEKVPIPIHYTRTSANSSSAIHDTTTNAGGSSYHNISHSGITQILERESREELKA
jgi:hypothetical protein